MSARIAGELDKWPTKEQLAAILDDAGLRIRVGSYSIRINDCSHFVFQEYGGDRGDPQVDADAETVDDMMRDGQLVSDVLARAGIRHRFEIYDDEADDPNAIAGYLHHEWALPESAELGIAPDEVNPPAPNPDATPESN